MLLMKAMPFRSSFATVSLGWPLRSAFESTEKRQKPRHTNHPFERYDFLALVLIYFNFNSNNHIAKTLIAEGVVGAKIDWKTLKEKINNNQIDFAVKLARGDMLNETMSGFSTEIHLKHQ